jgi:large subunit ribosomal protein L25
LELVELKAKPREKTGKSPARQLRLAKAIPAIVYGGTTNPILLTLDASEFDKIIRKYGTSGVFLNLKTDNSERPVMLKQVQMDVFGKHYIHVDLQAIDMDKKMTVTIPVHAVGICKGVKERGLLQIIRRELDVICKPTDRLESISIDVTNLGIGDAIHVEDIDLGPNIKIPHETNFTVLTVIPPESDVVQKEETEEAEIKAA